MTGADDSRTGIVALATRLLEARARMIRTAERPSTAFVPIELAPHGRCAFSRPRVHLTRHANRALRVRSSRRPSSAALRCFPLREEARRDYRQKSLRARLLDHGRYYRCVAQVWPGESSRPKVLRPLRRQAHARLHLLRPCQKESSPRQRGRGPSRVVPVRQVDRVASSSVRAVVASPGSALYPASGAGWKRDSGTASTGFASTPTNTRPRAPRRSARGHIRSAATSRAS